MKWERNRRERRKQTNRRKGKERGQKREKAKQTQDSLARVKKNELLPAVAVKDTAKSIAVPVIDSTLIKSGPFGTAQSGSNEPIILENEFLKVRISPR